MRLLTPFAITLLTLLTSTSAASPYSSNPSLYARDADASAEPVLWRDRPFRKGPPPTYLAGRDALASAEPVIWRERTSRENARKKYLARRAADAEALAEAYADAEAEADAEPELWAYEKKKQAELLKQWGPGQH